tara:strand:+ start:739 stop:1224 length:486 start_codon:yes stop_codon:yes gene_type:complete
MNIKNILLSCVLVFGSMSLSGCYTQLAVFHSEVESDSYSVARPNLTYYGGSVHSSMPLSYYSMYNRYFGNKYNPYYYGGYYNDYYRGYVNYNYNVYIPVVTNKDNKPRDWVRGNTNDTSTSNLRITRSSQSSYNNTSTNSIKSSSSSSPSPNSGTRVTRRN